MGGRGRGLLIKIATEAPSLFIYLLELQLFFLSELIL